MKSKSLTLRIFLNTFLVGVAVYFLCSIIFIDSFYGYFENQIFSELEKECDYLSQIENFKNIKTENRITIIDFDGNVIFDSVASEKLENHASRKEFIEAMKNGTSKVSRYSSTMLQKTLYVAKRLSNQTVIRISCEQHTVGVLIFGMSQILLTLLIIALITSGIFASFLSKKITNTIEKIDFENPEKSETYEEFNPFLKRILEENFEKKQREEIRRQFSANVSHELKTPLTSISGFAEMMKSGLVDLETMKNFSEDIYNESQRMILLVNDILKLSKLDEESISMEKENIDIEETCLNLIKSLESTAKRKNVTIEFENKAENPIINGVPTVINEMIYNLIENAIKYNKENGFVFVKIENLKLEKNYLKISVKDTGIGFAENEKERIFERFYRIDKSRSKNPDEKTTGTGLGLSIVKHGAKYHNAKVTVKSVVGEGSEFCIVFEN